MNMEYMKHLRDVAGDAVGLIEEKTQTYGDSWKRRGGPGAWFTVVRPIDRLEGIMKKFDGDIFAAIEKEKSGSDGTALACVRDIMNYMILIEAHCRAVYGVKSHGPERPDAEVCDNCGNKIVPMQRWADTRNPTKAFCGESCCRRYHAESEPSPASGSHHGFIHPDDAEGEGPWHGPVVAGERLCHGFDARSLGESARADAMEAAGETLDERARAAARVPAGRRLSPGARLEAFRLEMVRAAEELQLSEALEYRTSALGEMICIDIDLRKIDR